MLTTLDFIERKRVLNESRYNHDFRLTIFVVIDNAMRGDFNGFYDDGIRV
jgi:hypothetical protein